MIDVLILEDDKLTRKGLISAMPWQEYDMRVVGEAGDGLQALAFLREQHVDLVLCDLEMPRMQGLEFIEKAYELYPRLFFVVLTLYTDFAKVQQALRLGAIDYIAKVDLDRESFNSILQRILNRIEHENQRRMSLSAADDGVSPYQLEIIVTKWKKLDWLWETEAMNQIWEKTSANPLTADQMQTLLNEISEQWNLRFDRLDHCRPPSPPVDYEAAHRWLESLRQLAADHVAASGYSKEVFKCLLSAREKIDQSLDQPLHVEDIARYASMSRSYFCKCFSDIYHMSFLEYLRTMRLRRACNQLINTSEAIQSIARACGYYDEKYFSRTFKSALGLSPSEYRKKHSRET